MKNFIYTASVVLIALFAVSDQAFGSVTAYTNRAGYLAAAASFGSTTTSFDFATKDDGSPITIPANDVGFNPLVMRGVKFTGSSSYGVRAYYNQLIYTAPFDTITATLPANTYAFGVDMGRSYGAAGTFTITVSSGQSYPVSVLSTDGAAFFGITSDQPLRWAKFTFDTHEFFVLDDFTYVHTQPARAWSNASPSGSTPIARHGHEMVWESYRSKVLMFGGRDTSGNVLNDIWEYDTAANAWTDVTPTSGSQPIARSHFGMAYDAARGKAIVYGGQCIGCINVNIIGDTWEWDSATRTWEHKPASTLVYVGMWGSQMAFDTDLQKVILYGGQPYWVYPTNTDTYSWDGTAWNLINAYGPTGRVRHSMATDPQLGKVVLFGGHGYSGTGTFVFLNDIWEFSGASWSQPTMVTGPSSRRGAAMAFDSTNGQTFMFGGDNLQDMWVWDGTAWSQYFPANAPSARSSEMVFDPANGLFVLFGGLTQTGPSGETFIFGTLDADADGSPDASDNCPLVSNPHQLDTDGDAIGDACDSDDDNDGVADVDDAFPVDPTESVDSDSDGTGNNSDTDDDNDGFSDTIESAAGSDPLNPSSTPEVCDGLDNDLNDGSDEGFTNTDGDTQTDCIDADDDNDGVPDTNDAFSLDPAEWIDSDGDGVGNNADPDDDNDAFSDSIELMAGSDPLISASRPEVCDGIDNDLNEGVDEGFANTDGDALANCVDPDDDNDSVVDAGDNCPLSANTNQADFDLDGIGDVCDSQTGPPRDIDHCKEGGWIRFDVPRRFDNQGDCIQFVNTGH